MVKTRFLSVKEKFLKQNLHNTLINKHLLFLLKIPFFQSNYCIAS